MGLKIKQVLIAVDQLANTLLGGYADETISAKAWRQRHKTRWYYTQRIIDALFFDPNHCYKSYLSEKQRKQLPAVYRF